LLLPTQLLIAVQGKGEQAPHFGLFSAAACMLRVARGVAHCSPIVASVFASTAAAADRDDTESHLKRVYTVILYMTDDTNSTAFPKFPASEFAVPMYSSEHAVEATNSKEMQRSVQGGLLEKDQYDWWRTRVGDMYAVVQLCPVLCVRVRQAACLLA